MWIRNGLHHQGTFYRSSLFLAMEYNLDYKTLADYGVNLQLYQKKETCVLLEETIAKCNSEGVSKVGSWELYLEEIDLKLALSSPLFLPFFYILVFMKYMSKTSRDIIFSKSKNQCSTKSPTNLNDFKSISI